MDLGCSGGGLVLDFILRGHRGFGVEGSDHPKGAQRAEWRVLRNNLFTADITRPFRLSEIDGGEPIQCDVISMWEVMEHIADEDLPGLFANIKAHLKPDGLFIGSVALNADDHNGASYHRTVKPQDWWQKRYAELGLPMITDHGFVFEDFCRGTGNGPIDGSFRDDPSLGFHFVARGLQSCPAPLGARQPDTGRVPRPPSGPCRDERSGPEIQPRTHPLIG